MAVLVGLAVHGPPKPKQMVMHRDGNLKDEDGYLINAAHNIYGWGTARENVAMTFGRPILVTREDTCAQARFRSLKHAAEFLGFNKDSLRRAANRSNGATRLRFVIRDPGQYARTMVFEQ